MYVAPFLLQNVSPKFGSDLCMNNLICVNFQCKTWGATYTWVNTVLFVSITKWEVWYCDTTLFSNYLQGRENEERTKSVISSLIELARSSDINLSLVGSLFRNDNGRGRKCAGGKFLQGKPRLLTGRHLRIKKKRCSFSLMQVSLFIFWLYPFLWVTSESKKIIYCWHM